MWKSQASIELSRFAARRGRSGAGSALAVFVVVAASLAVGGSVSYADPVRLAQLGPNPGAGPTYGYQPYNDRNPTGFYHPNGMGYGHYYLTQKYHAPRFRAFRYRKFRGS